MEITREMIESKVQELVDMIKEFEGSRGDAALYAISELVTWSSDSHFEGVGILAEALISWRNCSDEILSEEADKEDSEDKIAG